jgi:hypothetical protein
LKDEQDASDASFKRAGITSENMFPKSRKGQLDGILSEKLRLLKERMEKGGALFFHQLNQLPLVTSLQ